MLIVGILLATSSIITALLGNFLLSLSLVAFALSLLFNSRVFYARIDRFFGGKNRVYLAVQLFFLFGMFFLKATFFKPGLLDILFALVAITLILVFFSASDTPQTFRRVEPYRKQRAVIAYTQTLNLYAAAVAATTIGNLLTPPPTPGQIILSIGLLLGIVTVVVRFLAEAVLRSRPPIFRKIDKALIPTTMLLIAVGAFLVGISHI
ncbi:hypothetical protein [Lysinibacter sp. HNR]|uniref:hypothetical protein n=1 Tax=Lysinibacter sp. HNR TaxID=3031408 RepID=UPI0024358A57|nr:hypothetical protein [Lysinibacter sp. HNR]WGD38511.1 hypothetical protein FrondiHNR_06260 [Lysinibacter sp. HNR]